MQPVICKITHKHDQVDQVGLSKRKNGCWLLFQITELLQQSNIFHQGAIYATEETNQIKHNRLNWYLIGILSFDQCDALLLHLGQINADNNSQKTPFPRVLCDENNKDGDSARGYWTWEESWSVQQMN